MNINSEVIAQHLIELIKNTEIFKENLESGMFQNDPDSLYLLIEEQLHTYIVEPIREIAVKELESLVFCETNVNFDDDADLEDTEYE